MPTFKITVRKDHCNADGKYSVAIRITHLRKSKYIKTGIYIGRDKLTSKFEIKDRYIIIELNNRINGYEELIYRNLGEAIGYSAQELVAYINKQKESDARKSVDFVLFAQNHIDGLKHQGRESYAKTFETTLRVVIDFCAGRDRIEFSEINYAFISKFDAYLRTTRTIKRTNQLGKIVITENKPVSETTIGNYITNIRTLFNAAVKEYNDDEGGSELIPHYPFRKYKIQKSPSVNINLPASVISRIFEYQPDATKKRQVLARDMFVLSFLLVGMNVADLYEVDKYKDGRIEYQRKKTRQRRADNAFISIKVEPEAIPLLEKYADPKGERVLSLYNRFRDSRTLGTAIRKGLKQLAEELNIEENLTTYCARHSWATIARNDCRISKEDIHMALNHVDNGMKVTDIYIAKDFTLIDEANRKVIDFVL